MYKLIPRGFFMLRFKSILLGCSVSALALALLLCAAAAFMVHNGLLSSGAAAAVLAVCSAISVFCGAWTAAHTAGEKGLLHGAAIAVLFCTLYIAAALLLSDNTPDIPALLLRSLPAMIAGLIGGVSGVGEKKKITF